MGAVQRLLARFGFVRDLSSLAVEEFPDEPPPGRVITPVETDDDWEWEIATARVRVVEPAAVVTVVTARPRTVLPVPALPVQSENCRVRFDEEVTRRVPLPPPRRMARGTRTR